MRQSEQQWWANLEAWSELLQLPVPVVESGCRRNNKEGTPHATRLRQVGHESKRLRPTVRQKTAQQWSMPRQSVTGALRNLHSAHEISLTSGLIGAICA
jgi:hypothetical protein